MPDPKLFEVLGKYAGLAGFSVGFVMLVFMLILRKKFPGPNQAYSLAKQLMYLTFALGVFGIALWFLNGQQYHRVTGHVLEKNSKKPLSGADIVLSGRPETASSDSVGNFDIPLVSQPLPSGVFRLYISKEGFNVYDVGVVMGQNIEAEMIAAPVSVTTAHDAVVAAESEPILTTEKYNSDQVASGACKDFGAWATICTPDKPDGWSIVEQHFELIGDRAGCAYAECQPLGTITATKACYRFRTQGHDEECGHSGNTGIHYSQGILTVTWRHH